MTNFVKKINRDKDEEDYFHWKKECKKYPIKGKDTILIFNSKPPKNSQRCPICTRLDGYIEPSGSYIFECNCGTSWSMLRYNWCPNCKLDPGGHPYGRDETYY